MLWLTGVYSFHVQMHFVGKRSICLNYFHEISVIFDENYLFLDARCFIMWWLSDSFHIRVRKEEALFFFLLKLKWQRLIFYHVNLTKLVQADGCTESGLVRSFFLRCFSSTLHEIQFGFSKLNWIWSYLAWAMQILKSDSLFLPKATTVSAVLWNSGIDLFVKLRESEAVLF